MHSPSDDAIALRLAVRRWTPCSNRRSISSEQNPSESRLDECQDQFEQNKEHNGDLRHRAPFGFGFVTLEFIGLL
jgi:hypothetical protein